MSISVKDYFEALRGKRILVLGLGVSNRPLMRMLLSYGLQVTGCDKLTEPDEELLGFQAQGAVLKLGPDYLKDLTADVVFRTPGMHPNQPAIAGLRDRGAVITSEMEAFFEVCPCRILAVTGSDGKTTTTTLISELLKKAGRRVFVGGNIGQPLLPLADQMTADDLAVLELSSFQLMTMQRSADVAVVTNLAPNHLDIHKDMAEYIAAKENIYLHQGAEGKLVLNLDNEITASFAPKAKGSVSFFSRQAKPENGVYLEGDTVYRVKNGAAEAIMTRKDILLPGIHNVENYMAAICAVDGLVSDEDIRAVAASFGGVEHRIELVRVKDGVSYYNDSIASSPSRTIAGLRSFDQKLIVIAGGYDKHIPYDVLGPEICEHVKLLVLTGATAPKIRAAVEGAPQYRPGMPEMIDIDDFKEAVLTASAHAQSGDVVILSPASASFDKFKNFMVRGNTFKQIVNEL